MNLVSNAIKFTSDGFVVLRLRGKRTEAGIKLVMRIADTGIGIAKDKIPLLFDPFFQVESGMSRSYSGTGLGSRYLAPTRSRHGRNSAGTERPGSRQRLHSRRHSSGMR